MKKFLGISFAALSLMTTALTSCQNEDVIPVQTDEKEILNIVAVASIDDDTRTSKPMNEAGSLNFLWAENDKLVIISKDGSENCGVLAIKDGIGEKRATFSGSIGVSKSTTEVNVYYLGRKETDKDALESIAYDFKLDISNQIGVNENITDYDVMHSVGKITRNEDGTANLTFSLKSIVSMAHFCLNLPEGSEGQGDVVVNGNNMISCATLDLATATFIDNTKEQNGITVTPDWTYGDSNEGSIFMVVLPGSNIDTEFTVTTTDEKILKGAAKNRTYNANKIFNGSSARGKDIYFSEDGSWTLTYMNGEEIFETATADNFGPSVDFTITDKTPEKAAQGGAAPEIFQGWAESEGGAVVYTAGNVLTLNRPETEKTLYAVYAKDNSEQTFTLTGIHVGRDMADTVKEVKGAWPTTVNVASVLNLASADKYDFAGYYEDAACTKSVSTVTYNYNNKNINVYCKWTKKAPTSFTVVYTDGVPGVFVFSDQVYEDLKVNDKTPDFDGGKPTRDGYAFMGWAPTINPKVSADDADDDGVITYSATWNKVNKSEATVGTPGSTGTKYGN